MGASLFPDASLFSHARAAHRKILGACEPPRQCVWRSASDLHVPDAGRARGRRGVVVEFRANLTASKRAAARIADAVCTPSTKPLTPPSPGKSTGRGRARPVSAHFHGCARRFTPSPCEIPARLRDGTTRGEGGVRGHLTVQSSCRIL